ncbi:MAG TPA: hypothetical protein VIX63_05480, partial [Vicinamibacterales bacterium]
MPIDVPAFDPFSAARQAAWTCTGEEQQVLFSRPRYRYSAVALTNAKNPDESSGLSDDEDEAHSANDCDDDFDPPDSEARHYSVTPSRSAGV